MVVHFGPELQAKLKHIASQQGRDTEALVPEPVELGPPMNADEHSAAKPQPN